jgi:hypothetical protein
MHISTGWKTAGAKAQNRETIKNPPVYRIRSGLGPVWSARLPFVKEQRIPPAVSSRE